MQRPNLRNYLLNLLVGTCCALIAVAGCRPQSPSLLSTQQKPRQENQRDSAAVTDLPQATVAQQDSTPAEPPAAEVVELFDGKTMEGWELTNFGGERECRVEDGKLIVEAGYPMSGVHSTREDLPTNNYEISLDAKKVEGIDFFCALTFPVDDSHCTFVVGGWAGAVVGLSCVDEQDASHNETRKLMNFEAGQWYKVKLRVEPKRIQAWLDDERVVDLDTEGRTLSLRNETLPSRPLGICTFETTSEFKNIKLTKNIQPSTTEGQKTDPQVTEPRAVESGSNEAGK